MSRPFLVVCLLGAMLAGCGSDAPKPPPQQPNPGGNGDAPPGARPAPQAAQAPGAKPTAGAVPSDLPPLPQRAIGEPDFVESPSNRDPFRSYAELFKAQQAGKKVVIQRNVLASKYALDELKIVGIVTGEAGRVLLNDPSGLGWVIKVGDYVGKPEVVHSGGATGADVTVNWRVDKIRTNDVVFIREDPSRVDLNAPTRTLSLRTAEELNPEIRTGVRPPPPPPPPPGGAVQPPGGREPPQKGT